MTLKDQTLNLIERRKWAFDLIGPHFRQSLSRRVFGKEVEAHRDLSLMDLTLIAYEIADYPSWRGLSKNGRPINPQNLNEYENQVLSRVAKETHSSSSVTVMDEWQLQKILTAEEIVRDHAPETFKQLTSWVNSYILLNNVNFRSGSNPHAFGCVFFGEKVEMLTPLELSVSIVHEMAHQELFLINLLDRLIEANADFNLVHAPFQGVKRPPIGRLHSLYALFRMVEFERIVGMSSQRHVRMLHETIDSFGDSELSAFGWNLVNTLDRLTPEGSGLENASCY